MGVNLNMFKMETLGSNVSKNIQYIQMEHVMHVGILSTDSNNAIWTLQQRRLQKTYERMEALTVGFALEMGNTISKLCEEVETMKKGSNANLNMALNFWVP